MNFLFDTNILIAVEPTAPSGLELGTEAAVQLVRTLQQHGHKIVMHPASLRDLENDPDDQRRHVRRVLLGKYAALPAPPAVTDEMRATVGPPTTRHDEIDDQLLAAVVGQAVHHLVTEDRKLHGKARRLDLGDRVLTVDSALELLRRLHPEAPEPPPSVEQHLAHELDGRDPIFDSFRQDYVDFDNWLAKVRQEQRTAWVVRREGELAAVCLIKEERAGNDLGLVGSTLKISSLKVSERHPGHKYGELLLRTVFEYAHLTAFEHLYLSVFEKHHDLIALLEDFGFTIFPDRRSGRGELYLHKPLVPEVDPDGRVDDPLGFHRRYGPPALHPQPPAAYLIPIRPVYHALLFPDAQRQLVLDLVERRPYGNAIKKAYLSRASIKTLEPGSTVAFYRSGDTQAVDVVGVVEDSMRSGDPEAITGFVGTRTVYRLDDIVDMCRKGEVLAILFRYDRVLPSAIDRHELTSNQVVRAVPQSIVRLRPEATRWLQDRIDS